MSSNNQHFTRPTSYTGFVTMLLYLPTLARSRQDSLEALYLLQRLDSNLKIMIFLLLQASEGRDYFHVYCINICDLDQGSQHAH